MRRSGFLSGLGVAAVSAGAGRPAFGQELVTVNVAYLGIATDAPIWVADQLGYFREQGIKLNMLRFTSSETMMAPLSVNQLDVGAGAPGASLYNGVIHGTDVRAVADAATDPPGYGWSKLMIRTELVKSGRFKTIKDLKGMTIAGAARASSSSPQVARLVAKAGLKYNDIKRTVLPYPQHVVALQNGAIEASLTIEPFATIAADNGAAVAIMGNDQFYPNQEVSCVLFSGPFIKNRRDVGVRYLRALLRGVRYYEDGLQNGKFAGPNGDEIVKVIAERTGAAESLIRRTTPVSIDPNGKLNLNSMREDLAWYKQQGFIEGQITSEQVVDTSLAADAVKRSALTEERSEAWTFGYCVFFSRRSRSYRSRSSRCSCARPTRRRSKSTPSSR